MAHGPNANAKTQREGGCSRPALNRTRRYRGTEAAAPSYTVASTCLRFPSSGLATALLSEVQQIVPLVHIRLREGATAPAWQSGTAYAAGAVVNYGASPVPYFAIDANTGNQPDISPTHWRPFDIFLSDRRVTVGGQLYLPRLIGIGEAGSDVLISQDIKGASDNVRFAFGNADRVMTQLANDTDLKYAAIDLCLFHVNSGIVLQLWKGVIQNYVSDGTPVFPVTCSDGFFQIMNQYPERQLSRQCWKTFNDGVNCPYAAHGSGGDPDTCDYFLESANGCQAHGMARYFGGHQADPQGVIIKDDSTGFLGFGRNTVTATSIISDTVWGLALPEMGFYRIAEDRLMRAICRRFGLRPEMPSSVMAADKVALATEFRDVTTVDDPDWIVEECGIAPISDYTIFPWPPAVAEDRFLRRFWELSQ